MSEFRTCAERSPRLCKWGGPKPVHGHAFTLLELLVVIAIIAVLVSLLAPMLRGAREHVWDVTCKSNLKQLSEALHQGRGASGLPAVWSWISAVGDAGAASVTTCPLGAFEDGGSHVPVGTTGAVVQISPPPSVVFNDFESSTEIRMFVERTNYVLPSPITVNISEPGRYGKSNASYNATKATLSAGTGVDCHFVFFDPVGSQSSVVSGSVTMGSEILGIMCVKAELDATDSSGMLGRTGTSYPTGQNSRDFEKGREDISLSEDRRTITIHEWHSTFPGENMRVLTRPGSGGAGSFGMNIQVRSIQPRPGQILLIDYNSSVVYPKSPSHVMALENMEDDGRFHLGNHLNGVLTDGGVRSFKLEDLTSDSSYW